MRRNKEYILEFIQQGRFMKVTAVDPETGTEATIVGDPNETEAELTRVAVNKLEYILNKSNS